MAGLPQPYPWSATILWNELDAGLFEGAADGGEIVGHRDATPSLEIPDGAEPQRRRVRELGLRPVDKPAAGATLGGQ